MAQTIALAISRQVASGGEPIARLLAQRLGFSYLNRALLRDMAGHLQKEPPAAAGRAPRPVGFWGSLIGMFATAGQPTTTGGVPPVADYASDRHLLEAEAGILREVAGRRDIVVLGRAGSALLADHPGLVSVFLKAPRARRARVLQDALRLSGPEEALAVLDACDRERGEFVTSVSGHAWTDATSYHLCLDTGRLGYADAAEVIMALVERTRQHLAG